MRRVLIVGKGGFGREVYEYLTVMNPCHVMWVDDRDPDAQFTVDTAPFGGSWPTIIAVGDPRQRESLTRRVQERGATLPCFSFDGALVRSRVPTESGVIVCPHSIVTAGVKLGRGVQINLNCVIGHDAEIGEFTTLSPSVDIMGHAKIGARVFFGAGATVIPGVTIGDDVVVGAGSVVIRDIPAGARVVGNPARVL